MTTLPAPFLLSLIAWALASAIWAVADAELDILQRVSDPAETPQRAPRRPSPKFPWVALFVLLVTLYLFWVLPYQVGSPPVKVEFSGKESSKQ
jgi:hypothetical protein